MSRKQNRCQPPQSVDKMYESYYQTRSRRPRDPIKEVLYHTGRYDEVSQRCRKVLPSVRQQGPDAIERIKPLLQKCAFDSRILRLAWDQTAAKGPSAAGPDGWQCEHFDEDEIWSLLKELSCSLRSGDYCPGSSRQVRVLKDPSNPARGTRTLTILNLTDRIVQRAILEVLTPWLDPLFKDDVFGFRPKRDRMQALAHAHRLAADGGRYVWVAEDIQNAFDHVPRRPLLEVVRNYVPSEPLAALIERMVQTDNSKRGIPQGAPLSPLLLNLYLHHHFEVPWARSDSSQVPVIRVADDLLFLCQSNQEAEAAWFAADKLLTNAGMPLKHGLEEARIDLDDGGHGDWLGYRVRRASEGLTTRIAKKAWGRLVAHLRDAHEKPNAPLRANQAIQGWLDQLGPCHDHVNRSRVLRRVQGLAEQHGFEEIPSLAALRFRWLLAHVRWMATRWGAEGGLALPNRVAEKPARRASQGLRVSVEYAATGEVYHQGIWLRDGSYAFRRLRSKPGSETLEAFLALITGLRFLHKEQCHEPIYTANKAAIDWLHSGRIRCRAAAQGQLNASQARRLTRALRWLVKHQRPSPSLIS